MMMLRQNNSQIINVFNRNNSNQFNTNSKI